MESAQADLPRRGLSGTASQVTALAFSPDGQALAAAGTDDTTRLWDLASGTVTATFAHPDAVTATAWDGASTLVTGAADGTVRLWPVPPPVLAAGGPVSGITFGPGGLAVASPGLRLWNTVTHQRAGPVQVTAGVTPEAVASSAGQHELATAGSDGSVRLWTYTAAGTLTAAGMPLRGSATGQAEAVALQPGRTAARRGRRATGRSGSGTPPVRHSRSRPSVPSPRRCSPSRSARTDGTSPRRGWAARSGCGASPIRLSPP